jgi:hypothetical protein
VQDMKAEITKKITIDLTLDSSETIMFTKGGMHKIFIGSELFNDKYDEYEITIQIASNEQEHFDFITGEAKKHKERVLNEAKST